MAMPCFHVTCGPNEALVLSGCCHKKPLIVAGGRVFVWPIFQEVHRLGCLFQSPNQSESGVESPNQIQHKYLTAGLPLNIMTLHVESPKVYTSQGVPISVTGIAQIKIQGQNEEMLYTACEMFLGKNEIEIANIALATLEGHQRAIMGSMTVEEIYKDRKKFNENVFEVASSDLVNMGITVVSYTLKDINDDQGYLMSLGMERTAQVKRDARIGEAEANRDALIKEAKAEMERIASRLKNDTEIAKAKRDYEIKKAEYEVEALKKKAEAEMAFELRAAVIKQRLMEEKVQVDIVERNQEISLEQQEVLRKAEELKAKIMVPADAEKYRLEAIAEATRKKLIHEAEAEAESIRLKGEAEAFAIKAKGKAEAEQMGKKAEALNEYSEAALMDMVFEALPEIFANIAAPIAETKKITVVSSGAGDVGPAKIAGEIFSIISRVPEAVKSITGVDITSRLHSYL